MLVVGKTRKEGKMEGIREFWKTYLFEGIILVILGVLALAAPTFITLSINYLLGFLLIIGGIAQGYRAIVARVAPGYGVTLVASIVSIVAGILLVTHPWIGALTITMLLALFFFFEGISKVIYAIEYRQTARWGLILFSGFVSLLLAGLIWSQWPISGTWVLGVYVGVYLLMIGFSLIFLALDIKRRIA